MIGFRVCTGASLSPLPPDIHIHAFLFKAMLVFKPRALIATLRQRLPSMVRKASSKSYSKIIPLDTPAEEETLPHYRPEMYYPVNIGDLYEDRYQIAGKLGYGAYSTSWLCRDLQYVCIATEHKNKPLVI